MVLTFSSLETCTRESFFPSLADDHLLHAQWLVQRSPTCSSENSDIDFLWQESLRDRSQWWDNRKSKSNQGSPDFKHKTAQESVWLHCLHNPCWAQEELRKQGLLSSAAEIEAAKESVVSGSVKVYIRGEEKAEDDGAYLLDTQEQSQNDVFDALSLVATLKVCAKKKDLHGGSQVHTQITEKGLLKTNIFVGNTLVNMYARCGALEKAHEVFDELPVRNVVSWNALITGYAQEGLGEETFICLERMKLEGFSPNSVTFTCLINACGSVENIQRGQELHADIVKFGLLKEGSALCTALLDMYANCGMLAEAQALFDNSLARDVVAWTALLTGYAQHGNAKEALECYDRMQSEGCCPNAITYSSILKACGSIGVLERGQEIHSKIVQEGLLEKDRVVANALLDMYAKCGFLERAQGLFDERQVVDVVSWTALITGYTLYGFGEEALSCFKEMRNEGLLPDIVTFSCILKACSMIGAVRQSQVIHDEIVRWGLLETNRAMCTALVDMYAKSGMLIEAQGVFDKMLRRDVIVWTALMEGYGQVGKDDVVFDSFDKMTREGIKPNLITFTILINSCCHKGLLEEGEIYFEMISKVFNTFPTLEHLTCLVDLYGRAGQWDQALAIMEEMPFYASSIIWHTLLCTCQSFSNMELGAWVLNHARFDVTDASTYVCISNMYGGAGGQVDELVGSMGVASQAWKELPLRWWNNMDDTAD